MPYPISFTANCVNGEPNPVEGFSLTQLGLSVPNDMSLNLHGHYSRWAKPAKISKSKSDCTWVQITTSATLVDVSTLARVDIKQANKKNLHTADT